MTPPAASLDLALRAAIVAALQSPEGQAAIRAAVQAQVVPFQPRAPERMKVRRAAEIADKCQDTIRRAIKAKELKASKAKGSREWIIEYAELQRWMGGRAAPRAGPVDIPDELDKAVGRFRR